MHPAGLFLRLQRRPGLAGRSRPLSWDEFLAITLARLLESHQGSRSRHGLSRPALAARDLGDDLALRALCDELAQALPCLDRRLREVHVRVVSQTRAGVVCLAVKALAGPGSARCTVRLSPHQPPDIQRPS